MSRSKGLLSPAFIYCSLLAVQTGLQPILIRYFSSSRILKSSLVITTELLKIGISLVLIFLDSPEVKRKITKEFKLSESIRFAAIPAVLYAVQNLLMQYGYDKIDGVTFNVLNQTKTISAAVFVYFLLGKIQSRLQIVALVIVFFAAVLLQAGSSVKTNASGSFENAMEAAQDYQLGILLVLAASAISGLSGALSQKVLNNPQNPRLSLLLSAEMAVYGIAFLAARLAMSPDELAHMKEYGFFSGWSLATWLPVTANACGGLVVGQVTKHAGSVAKGFALISGLILTGFTEWVLGGKVLHWSDCAAAAMVSLAIYIHSSFPPPPGTPPSIGSPIKVPPSPIDGIDRQKGGSSGSISASGSEAESAASPRKRRSKKTD